MAAGKGDMRSNWCCLFFGDKEYDGMLVRFWEMPGE